MNNKVSRRSIARTIVTELLEHPDRRRKWVMALAAYLIDTNRVDEIDLIVNDMAHELYAQRGELLVTVTSARKLTDQIRHELIATLKRPTGAKHISLHEQVDPTLVGGLVARTPDAWLDVSVRTKLNELTAIK